MKISSRANKVTFEIVQSSKISSFLCKKTKLAKAPPLKIGTKKANVMKFRGAMLEMISPRHTKNGTPQTLGGQVITVPGSVSGTIRTRKLASVLGSKISMF